MTMTVGHMPIFDPVTVPNEMGYSGCIDLKYPPFNLAVREKWF